MMIKQPALAPSPQPRPAPTVRALPAELAAQRGPFWMPIRGPNPTPIDTPITIESLHRSKPRRFYAATFLLPLPWRFHERNFEPDREQQKALENEAFSRACCLVAGRRNHRYRHSLMVAI